MTGGHAAWIGEKETTKKYGNNSEVGPDTAKPISIELGRENGNPDDRHPTGHDDKARRSEGRRAQRGDGSQKMKLAIERTLLRSEADAINATNVYEEVARARRDGEGGW